MASLRLATRLHLPQIIRSGAFRQTHRNASTSAVRPENPLRTGLYTTLFVVSTGLFAAYYFDSRSAVHRYVFTPLLRHLVDAETGHKIAVKVLRSGLAPRDTQVDDEVLNFEVCFILAHSWRHVLIDVTALGSICLKSCRSCCGF